MRRNSSQASRGIQRRAETNDDRPDRWNFQQDTNRISRTNLDNVRQQKKPFADRRDRSHEERRSSDKLYVEPLEELRRDRRR
ncbi:hypothetical protein Cus16_1918 [Curtobacterium sp. ER1/6]|nr:hypothetical protein Cus16_1918 [Curtobacterium sp. ER1/6]